MPCRNVLPYELEALTAFAQHFGRRWKSVLSETYWFNARLWSGASGDKPEYGSYLHGLRNDPRFDLAAFRFPQGDTISDHPNDVLTATVNRCIAQNGGPIIEKKP